MCKKGDSCEEMLEYLQIQKNEKAVSVRQKIDTDSHTINPFI